MDLCGTCKFWGGPDDDGKYRQCARIEHDESSDTSSYEEWDEDEVKYYQENDPERLARHNAMLAEKAVAVDGSGYFAALRCREDFGCVYHEPKTTF